MGNDYVEIDGKKIRVYQICESDAVAAEWEEDAVEWYKNLTGLDDNELYAPEDIEVVDPERLILNGEGTEELISVKQVVEDYWNGEPFIAVTEYY